MPFMEASGAPPGSGPSIPLGPFQLERCIGRGGTAEVWSGVHAAQGVPVAVKVMTGERARESSFRAAFRNEVQAVASLDHPGIVIVFDHGETGAAAEEASRGLLAAGSPALAMELADGGTLGNLFADGVSWRELRQVLLDLLDALAHAHARGMVHRDLKPNNVLVFRDGGGPPRLKLADFGLAQAVELQTRHDSTEIICGTPSYMAPEQLRGHWRDYGAWTDLYGLGCLAWTLAAGRPPFGGAGLIETIRLQMEEEPPAFVPRTPVPRGFEGWLRRLLQKEPGHRFVRAADAAGALLDLAGTAQEATAAVGTLEPDEPTTQSISFQGLWSPAGPEGEGRVSTPASTAAEKPLPRRSPPLPPSWEHPAWSKPSIKLLGAGLGLYGLRSIPLLGRRGERDLLWRELAQVHLEGSARLVLLHGVAGCGKTHLAEWMAERAHEVGGAIVLRAYHGPNPGAEDGLPRMMARHLRCVGLTRQEILERTKVLLRPRKVTDPAQWNGLTDLMVPGSSRQTARERCGLLERHFQRLARQRPALVLLDDVHWGAESIELARYLLERREEEPVPILLLLTVRDEALAERPAEAEALRGLLALPGATAVEVPPLPAAERAALTREVLGLADDLAAAVDARTGGNPLFAVQLVGDWVQRGILDIGDTGFVLRSGAEAQIPDSLHAVWYGRVARLLESQPPEVRETAQKALEVAATLSPFVNRREWEAACRRAAVACPPELLEELVAGRLALRTEEGWSFVHAMLRESIERRSREEGRFEAHNRACAAMLEERLAAGERGVAERLGRHLLLAGERAAALQPLLAGAHERRGTSDYPAAQSLIAEREEALRELGIAEDDSRWGEGWVLRARIQLHQGQLEEVFRWAERAEAGGPGSWASIRAEALRLLGDAARRRGDLDRARALYERGIGLADHHGAAASFWGLGDIARQLGRPEEARTFFDRSLALYREIGDEHGIADHGIGAADLARQRREIAAAEDLYRQTLHRFETLGNRYGVARSLNGLGDVARLQGDFTAAAESYSRALVILDGLRSADSVFPRLNLALTALAEQRFSKAETALREICGLLELLGWGGLLSCVHVSLLTCAAQGRDWASWDDHLALGASALRRSGLLDPDVAWCAELAGRLTEWAGQPARAREAYELALAQWRGLQDDRGVQRIERALRSA